MALPHHHVFNSLQHAIIKTVKVEDVLPHLIEKKVISKADEKKYSNPKSGMKSLINLLRNRNFQTFLTFAECLCLVQREPLTKGKPTMVDSMIQAVQEYDREKGTKYTTEIDEVKIKFVQREMEMQQALETKAEQTLLGEEAGTEVEQSLVGKKQVVGGTERKQTHIGEEARTKVEQTLVEEKSPSLEEASSVSGFTMPTYIEYVEEPVTVSFKSQGGQFPEENKYHGLSIMVPPRAISEGQEVRLCIGVCCCGPFSISKQYEVASAFYVIIADGKFSLPVSVVMDHCLILHEYKKCREVLVLKSSQEKNGLYTFDQYIYPEISSVTSELSFEINEFCVLCAVLDEDDMVRTSSLESSASSSQANIDDSNPSSAQSSFDEEALHPLGVERSNSEGSQVPYKRTFSNSSESGMESSLEVAQKANQRKRKADSFESEDPAPPAISSRTFKSTAMIRKRPPRLQGRTRATPGKRRCAVEYAALLFQSKEKMVDVDNQSYQFAVFICTNCGVIQEICMNHARALLDSDVELLAPITITIDSKVLKLETTTQRRGWQILPERTPEISKSEVRSYSTLDRKDLVTRIDMKTYPPRLKFTAEFNDTGPIRSFSCKVEIKGATTTQTQNEVFFNITASIPKQTRPIGYLNRQEAMDCSYMGHYPPQYYPPSQQGQFLPPPHFQQQMPQYQRQDSDLMARSQSGWYLPPNISGQPQLSQEGYGLSQSSSSSHGYVQSQGSSSMSQDVSSHRMQRLSLQRDSSQESVIVRSTDVGPLMSRLNKHAHKWREIGMSLGFEDGELKNIVGSNLPTSTPQQLLTELLSQWSQWPTDAHQDKPTLDKLCAALRSRLVGLGAVAIELNELYQNPDVLQAET